MPFSLLLAMQAAGMIVDYFGTKQQSELMNKGLEIKQAGIEANIEQTRLETAEQSLQDMKQLRQTMGTQIATMSARGTSTSGGSSVAILNESIHNFDYNERIRSLNEMSQINSMKAQSALSSLENNANNAKLWSGFTSRTFSKFSTDPSAYSAGWGKVKKDFGLTPV